MRTAVAPVELPSFPEIAFPQPNRLLAFWLAPPQMPGFGS